MEKRFDLSEAVSVYVESDNDGRAVYVIAKHRDGWTMRTDAPTVDGDEWLTTAERFRWARNEAKRQRQAF